MRWEQQQQPYAYLYAQFIPFCSKCSCMSLKPNPFGPVIPGWSHLYLPLTDRPPPHCFASPFACFPLLARVQPACYKQLLKPAS